MYREAKLKTVKKKQVIKIHEFWRDVYEYSENMFSYKHGMFCAYHEGSPFVTVF
jgi:hypothetical protein